MSTTIRVPRELHERLSRRAHEEASSLADVIAHALDAQETADFWQRVRATMTDRGARASLRSEAERASATLKDGLDGDESWDDVL